MVGHRPLKASILVRIQVPQHFDSLRSLSASPLVRSEVKCPELAEGPFVCITSILSSAKMAAYIPV